MESCFEDHPDDRPKDAAALADAIAGFFGSVSNHVLSHAQKQEARVRGDRVGVQRHELSDQDDRFIPNQAAACPSRQHKFQFRRPEEWCRFRAAHDNSSAEVHLRRGEKPRIEAPAGKFVYEYEAMDHTGREIRDTITASSQEEAQQMIRQKGFFVTKILESKKTSSRSIWRWLRGDR